MTRRRCLGPEGETSNRRAAKKIHGNVQGEKPAEVKGRDNGKYRMDCKPNVGAEGIGIEVKSLALKTI